MNSQKHRPGRATLFDIRTFTDARGALSVLEESGEEGGEESGALPFRPRRLYYLYGSTPGQIRGGHANIGSRQCLIAMAGALEVDIDDGTGSRTFILDRPDLGLLLEPVLWRVVRFRDTASVLAVLASDLYDEDDYIGDYEAFRALVAGR